MRPLKERPSKQLLDGLFENPEIVKSPMPVLVHLLLNEIRHLQQQPARKVVFESELYYRVAIRIQNSMEAESFKQEIHVPKGKRYTLQISEEG